MIAVNQIIHVVMIVVGLINRNIRDSNTPGVERSIPNRGKTNAVQKIAQRAMLKNSNVGMNWYKKTVHAILGCVEMSFHAREIRVEKRVFIVL